jgi:hypothetical protein
MSQKETDELNNSTLTHSIGFDKSSLDGKVIVDDAELLGYPTIIASEIVQQYEDGYAYKSAEALQKMADSAKRSKIRPVKILEHPGADTNYLLLKDSDQYGYVTNFQFVNNLIDEKTKRPCRRGVKADVYWYKDRVPQQTLDAIKKGEMLDVSIGFTFDKEPVAGTFEGQHYDYKQTNIFLDHLAAPIPAGRCPGPLCGIGYDSSKIQVDAKVMSVCPVCSHMNQVGWGEAGKRLYAAYGPDVLEVIDSGYKPIIEAPKTSVDEDFIKAFKTLEAKLQQ